MRRRGITGGTAAARASDQRAGRRGPRESAGCNVFAVTLTPLACSDGIDDDGDERIDFPEDPGCPFETAIEKDPDCDDRLDNDRDGRVDFEDPECSPGWPYTESPAACGLGFELVFVLPPLMGLYARRRRRSAGR